MSKIELKDNKSLKLINVVYREFPINTFKEIGKYIQMMVNWIKSNKTDVMGPVIVHTYISNNDESRIGARLIMQTKIKINKVDTLYKEVDEVKVSNCLYTHYDGPKEKSQFGSEKIFIYAFENGIELTSETYSVFLKETETDLAVDYFVPKKDSHAKR